MTLVRGQQVKLCEVCWPCISREAAQELGHRAREEGSSTDLSRSGISSRFLWTFPPFHLFLRHDSYLI